MCVKMCGVIDVADMGNMCVKMCGLIDVADKDVNVQLHVSWCVV